MATNPPPPTQREGDSGPLVRVIQAALNNNGFNVGAADGDFGPKTKQAVMNFQRSRGLGADGVVGPKTWAALGATNGSPVGPTPPDSPPPTQREGDSGPIVIVIQTVLNNNGFNVGAADGDFGPKTKQAVMNFQAARGLSADGVVGPMTWAALGERPSAPGAIDVQRLGKLSAKYESNGNPGTVSTGAGDRGGVSYGSYQFATNTGSAKAFVNSLNKTRPQYGKAFAGLTPGTSAFSAAWKNLAAKDPKGFGQAQHDYIGSKFYQPAKAQTEATVRSLDFDKRSQTLNDVLWSTAVQHGPAGASKVISRALAGKDVSRMSDADIARAIYAERGRKNSNGSLAYFSGSSAAVQRGVANRFQSELKDALASMGRG